MVLSGVINSDTKGKMGLLLHNVGRKEYQQKVGAVMNISLLFTLTSMDYFYSHQKISI